MAETKTEEEWYREQFKEAIHADPIDRRGVNVALDNGVDPDEMLDTGSRPLQVAAGREEFGVVLDLMKAGADPAKTDTNGRTMLHSLSYNRVDREGLDELLTEIDENVQPVSELLNQSNDFDNTPFHQAVKTARSELIELLAEHGADIEASGRHGNLPIHELALSMNGTIINKDDWKESVQTLLDLDSPLNVTNLAGVTPLHMVIRQVEHESDFSAVRFFLDQGAEESLNIQDERGNTPVHYFVDRQDFEYEDALLFRRMVRTMVEAGADPSIENDAGTSVLERAERGAVPPESVVEELRVE